LKNNFSSSNEGAPRWEKLFIGENREKISYYSIHHLNLYIVVERHKNNTVYEINPLRIFL